MFFSGMVKNYLLSVGKLCNEVYSVTFKIDGVAILNNQGKAILKGELDAGTGLM
jgi:hypothetical protein